MRRVQAAENFLVHLRRVTGWWIRAHAQVWGRSAALIIILTLKRNIKEPKCFFVSQTLALFFGSFVLLG